MSYSLKANLRCSIPKFYFCYFCTPSVHRQSAKGWYLEKCEKVKITAPQCTVQSPCWVASLVPAPGKFHTSATGYLKYRDSQRKGAIPADENPIIFHYSLVAEISTPCIN